MTNYYPQLSVAGIIQFINWHIFRILISQKINECVKDYENYEKVKLKKKKKLVSLEISREIYLFYYYSIYPKKM